MRIENLNAISQLIEAEDSAVKELEKALEKGDVQRINRSKEEILKFQEQISELL